VNAPCLEVVAFEGVHCLEAFICQRSEVEAAFGVRGEDFERGIVSGGEVNEESDGVVAKAESGSEV